MPYAVRKLSCKAVRAIHLLPHMRTHMLAKRTATSAHAENPFMNRWLRCEPQQVSGIYPVENLYLVDTRAAAPTKFECVLNSNCLLYCCAEPDQTTSDQTISLNLRFMSSLNSGSSIFPAIVMRNHSCMHVLSSYPTFATS